MVHSKLLDMMPLVSMSDEELREQVSKAKAGDEEAVAIVLSAVMPCLLACAAI